jgi:AbrB family looped-hinge helix DNA binding protein
MTQGEDIMTAAPKLSKVQKKGQVTIPIEIRENLGIQEGDFVAFIQTEDGVLISPQSIVAMRSLDQIGQALKEQGITLEELIESGRDIRGKLIKEKYGLEE